MSGGDQTDTNRHANLYLQTCRLIASGETMAVSNKKPRPDMTLRNGAHDEAVARPADVQSQLPRR
jgi:hypothetical protein